MNHLSPVGHLKNRYLVMRHGQSEANAARIINSHPEARMKYGLTALGRKRVGMSIESAQKRGWLDTGTIIYSSDFRRAFETAELVSKSLHGRKVHLTPALRERNFGQYEGKSTAHYAKIWLHDIQRHAHRAHNVETVFEIRDRTTKLIIELERKYSGKTILLVSHGDTLHVLWTAFKKIRPTRHRFLKHLGTAEIRRLNY